MKVRSITIPDLHHFKNLHLDLTYPAGHPKAGKALDKVCIIGQSGTGKTTLLKLITALTFDTKNLYSIGPTSKIRNIRFSLEMDNIVADLEVTVADRDDLYAIYVAATEFGKVVDVDFAGKAFVKHMNSEGTKSIHFPADLSYDMETDSSKENTYSEQKHIDFSIDKVADVWSIILGNIQKYQEEELILRQEISKVAERTSDINEIQEAVKKLQDWRATAFNPIKDVADNCLDRLIKKFGLRVKTELDFQKKEDIGFFKIEDLNGNEVPNGLLSTGTKQIMLSALPLYLLKPNKCQILFDEPERSLYPDQQRIIIDYYTNLTTDSQFFIATHSPIIASTFEPWEIVELKFDENYNIYRDFYFIGENHVDNYYIDPRYLDYDAVLKKVFDLKQTNSDLRTEAIVELTMLKNQLDKLKSEKKLGTPEGNEILERYKTLAKKLSWETE